MMALKTLATYSRSEHLSTSLNSSVCVTESFCARQPTHYNDDKFQPTETSENFGSLVYSASAFPCKLDEDQRDLQDWIEHQTTHRLPLQGASQRVDTSIPGLVMSSKSRKASALARENQDP